MQIGFVGKMGAGKTTAANYLSVYGLITTGFSRKLKSLAQDLFPGEFKNGNKPRELLQKLGYSLRQIDKDVWVSALLRQMKSSIVFNNVAIDDVRFLNEAEILRVNGFFIVKIETDRNLRAIRYKERYNEDISKYEDDPTEQEIDMIKPDFLLRNNSNLEEFYRQLDWMYNQIKSKDPKEKETG